jgi:hypothetical protein
MGGRAPRNVSPAAGATDTGRTRACTHHRKLATGPDRNHEEGGWNITHTLKASMMARARGRGRGHRDVSMRFLVRCSNRTRDRAMSLGSYLWVQVGKGQWGGRGGGGALEERRTAT